MAGIGGIDGGERIECYTVFSQQFETVHGTGESTLSPRVFPIYIMQVLRPVDADANAEVVVAEEVTPVIGEQRAVGL